MSRRHCKVLADQHDTAYHGMQHWEQLTLFCFGTLPSSADQLGQYSAAGSFMTSHGLFGYLSLNMTVTCMQFHVTNQEFMAMSQLTPAPAAALPMMLDDNAYSTFVERVPR